MRIQRFNDYVANEGLVYNETKIMKPKSEAELGIYTNLKANKSFMIETKNETTAIVLTEYYAKKLGMETIELFVGKDINGAEDIEGIPTYNGQIAMPKWATDVVNNPKKKYLVLIVGDIDDSIQNALVKPLTGKIADYTISNCTFVLLNNTQSLSSVLRSKLGQKPVVL